MARPRRSETVVDIETQCGVQVTAERRCARDLACRRHSMYSKRSVPGRSAPFDELLLHSKAQQRSATELSGLDGEEMNIGHEK